MNAENSLPEETLHSGANFLADYQQLLVNKG